MKRLAKRLYYRYGSWLFALTGRKPWGPGYVPFKHRSIQQALRARILERGSLPSGYGFRLDERIVEYPWLFAHLPPGAGRLLDAGSVLNYDFLLQQATLANKKVFISTLAPESEAYWDHSISYVYEDLRDSCFRGDFFDWVVSLSTIEHMGLDNTMLYTQDKAKQEQDDRAHLVAVREYRRVLKKGGTLYLSMPFGQHRNHGWFQVFNASMVDGILEAFQPASWKEFHFRYEPDGWVVSDRAVSAGATYFDINESRRFDPDYAAASRAIVCLELRK